MAGQLNISAGLYGNGICDKSRLSQIQSVIRASTVSTWSILYTMIVFGPDSESCYMPTNENLFSINKSESGVNHSILYSQGQCAAKQPLTTFLQLACW